MERRKSTRIQRRFLCEIAGARGKATGGVLDLSEGGLSVRTECEFKQGDPLRLRLQPPGCAEVRVEALVWHVRRVRLRRSGEVRWVLGLMRSMASDPYSKLVSGMQPRGDPVNRELRAEAPDLVPESAPELCAFRIRVKYREGSRTRILSLSAQSEDEARDLALQKLTDEWEILEVYAAERRRDAQGASRKASSG